MIHDSNRTIQRCQMIHSFNLHYSLEFFLHFWWSAFLGTSTTWRGAQTIGGQPKHMVACAPGRSDFQKRKGAPGRREAGTEPRWDSQPQINDHLGPGNLRFLICSSNRRSAGRHCKGSAWALFSRARLGKPHIYFIWFSLVSHFVLGVPSSNIFFC